ncbi:VTT domain-containing protein [Wenzhouxiangella sp. XN24]|uniref:VTT domain-containing protein n=1 Tax=Wenzhouxiangella sp. XN24 TaxID=2713569 RepID=UPI0013EBD281|nr:VTT domain-containing protein [Wenzhouxiangella sp. XN24]NGX17320.1 hypothetical protein [Wenzhouxiangella sp. XN24]
MTDKIQSSRESGVSGEAAGRADGTGTEARDPGRLLVPGRNCWRIEKASRVAFLVDGEDYFAAVRAAARKARHSIYVLGWDLDSRIRLVPEGADDGLPEELGDFFNALARRHRSLCIRLLDWDFAMLYATDRELLPRFKLGWQTHRRVRFELDGAHPVGASHHQKVVVIDDAVAFVGGLDLTHCRWDTSAHRREEPHRCHPTGGNCPPFHDLQMAVDGPAAAALGELARERWRRATGHAPPPSDGGGTDAWPEALHVDLDDAEVGIARTEPPYDGREGVQEIKALHLDAIGAARRQLYFENQYFSADSIATALVARLSEADGPEVAMVSRLNESGWLEEYTVGVLRARLHRRLREHAPPSRYRSFYPNIAALGDSFVNVHAKVFVIDDDLLTIGSANLNNRSMGFDTECNLVIESRGEERVRRAIRGLRHRLLAEHQGTTPAAVAAAEARTGSLLETIDTLHSPERALEPLEPEVPEAADEWIPEGRYLDPEKPVEPKHLVALISSYEPSASLLGRGLGVAAILLFFVGLAVLWRWTDLGDWLAPERLAGLVAGIRDMPSAPAVVLGGFVLGSVLVVPVTLMIAASVLVFGPLLGGIYAAVGSLLGAGVTYALGRFFGRETLRRLAGSRLDRLSRALARRGILAVVTVRIVPVAPFTIINLIAGASHISLRDFLLGTIIGLAPGILGAALFIDRMLKAIRDPGPGSFLILGLVLLAIVGAMALLRRAVQRSGQTPSD